MLAAIMVTRLLISSFFLLQLFDKCYSFGKSYSIVSFVDNKCETQIDSLTKQQIYTSADILPRNAGGLQELMRCYERINFDSIPPDYDTKFAVAFIVEVDGQLKGERILHDKTGQVGQQLIKVAKSLTWIPAVCNGRKVPMLYKLEMQVCLAEF